MGDPFRGALPPRPWERLNRGLLDALIIAEEEAEFLHHDHIGTEHLLLSLAVEGNGLGATVLAELGADPTRLRAALGRGGADGVPCAVDDDARRVLELMDAERAALRHQRIGQEHLLLALLRTETDAPGRAAIQLLACLGVQAEHVRERLQSVLANPSQLRTGPETAPPTKRGSAPTRQLIPRSHNTANPAPGTGLSRPIRLVIVEGIMGAGKSWTGQWLARELGRHGIESRFIAEGRTREGEVHPLRVATTLAHPRAPWRELKVHEYVDRSLAMWRAFVQEAESSSRVTICDGLLFHGNLTDAMLMGAAPAALADYVTQVAWTARPLAPVLVYLRQIDVAAALRRVSQQRGPAWVTYQVDWKLASPYAERRGLRGYDGLVQLYRDYVPLCLDILDRLNLPKLVLERDGDWPQVRCAVRTFLQLENLKEC